MKHYFFELLCFCKKKTNSYFPYKKHTNCYFFFKILWIVPFSYEKDTNHYIFLQQNYELLLFLPKRYKSLLFLNQKYENATNPSGPQIFLKYNTYCILLKSMLSPVGHNFQPKEVMIANLYNLFICWPSKNRSDWWGSDPGFESCIFCTTV